jgi:hypothetical protein
MGLRVKEETHQKCEKLVYVFLYGIVQGGMYDGR